MATTEGQRGEMASQCHKEEEDSSLHLENNDKDGDPGSVNNWGQLSNLLTVIRPCRRHESLKGG